VTLADLAPLGPDWLRWSIATLGGRAALVFAGFEVIEGVVWEKHFSLAVQMPPFRGPDGGLFSTTLLGVAESRSQLYPPTFRGGILRHPNYVVGKPGGCEGCVEIYAYFTPYADPRDVERLMQFNLDCLTRWAACLDESDVMPVAWRQYSDEKSEGETASAIRGCSPRFVEILGRDTQNAAIVDVIANRIEDGVGGERYQVSTVRLSQRLKRADFWNPGETEQVRVFEGVVALTSSNLPSEVRPGAKYILLFAEGHWGGQNGPRIWLDQCGAIPLTKENLALVKRGVDQDFRASVLKQDHP